MLSSSGFRDGLGQRDLEFDRETGQIRERLFLRAELAAYESALRRRVGRLASLEEPRLAAVASVERDHASHRLVIVSRHVSGTRLTDTLRAAREREVVPDLTIGLFLTAEILTAAQTFHSLSGLPHGALSPHSVVLTTDNEVVLTDYAYAEVIEAARFSARRLWEEFGIAHWLGDPFSFQGDVRQSALVAIAVMLGRPLRELDLPVGMSALLAEVEEAAVIRGGRLFADPVVSWLKRALGAGSKGSFSDAADAAAACLALLTDRERRNVRTVLGQFLSDLEAPEESSYEPGDAPGGAVGAKEAPATAARASIDQPIAEEEPVTPAEPEREFDREPARIKLPSSVIPFPRRDAVIEREPVALPELQPGEMEEPEKVALAEPEPAAFAPPDPEMFEPKPVFTELDLAAWLRPEPAPVLAPAPISVSEPEPEVAAEPAVVVEAEPTEVVGIEPIAEFEPKPISVAELEPFAVSQAEPVADEEPEPIAVLEPEPVAYVEPEPVAVSEPGPVAYAEPEPIVMPEQEPVAYAEPEPVAVSEPEPVAYAEPEPIPMPAPEPVAYAEPEPIAVSEPEPVAYAEPAPIAEPEPVPVATWEPEPQPRPEFEPVAESEPEPQAWFAPAPQAAVEPREAVPEAKPFEPATLEEPETEPLPEPETVFGIASTRTPSFAPIDVRPEPEPVFEPAAKGDQESWPVPPLEDVSSPIYDPERQPPPEPDWPSVRPPDSVPEPEPTFVPMAAREQRTPVLPPVPAPPPAMGWPPRAAEVDAPASVMSASPFALLDRDAAAPRPSPLPEPVALRPSLFPPPPAMPAEMPAASPFSVPPPMAPSLPPPAMAPPGIALGGGIRLKPVKATRSPSAGLDLSGTERPYEQEPEEPRAPRFTFKVPWKYGAAAAVLLVAGLAATKIDWPSSPKAAPVLPGTIVVESTPKGSEVFIDGKASGITPATIEVPPGRHELKLSRNGSSHSWSVEVAAGARRIERLDWRALRQSGGLEVLTTKPGARVLVDGKAVGETPLVLMDLTPGRHTVVVQGPNGNVRRTVRVVGGETVKLDLAIYSGWVVIAAPIELQIVENGRAIGAAGEGPVMLAAGHHTLDLVNAALDYRSTHEVEITPGEESRLVIEPTGLLSVNAVPWAEVFLDGTRLGETPLANVSVPLGTHELVFKHPQHGERRVPLTITASSPAQATVDFIQP